MERSSQVTKQTLPLERVKWMAEIPPKEMERSSQITKQTLPLAWVQWMRQEIRQKKCLRRTIFGCSLRTTCLSWKGAPHAVHVYHEQGAPSAVLLTQVKQRRSKAPKIRVLEASRGHFAKHFGSILGTFWAHFGGPERAWKKMPYKGGGLLFGAVGFC